MSGEGEHVKRKGTITKHFVVGQLPPELIIISGSLAQHLLYHSNLVKLFICRINLRFTSNIHSDNSDNRTEYGMVLPCTRFDYNYYNYALTMYMYVCVLLMYLYICARRLDFNQLS